MLMICEGERMLDAYDGAAGAGRFYAKCGFLEVGRKTYRGVPLVYFELMLLSYRGTSCR